MTVSMKPVAILILNYAGLLLFYSFFELLIEFLLFYAKIIWFINTVKDLLSWNKSLFDNEESNNETCSQEDCNSCGKYGGLLTGNDIDTVLVKLGMGSCSSSDDGRCKSCWLLEGASHLLEEKEAKLEELEEAFSVFDGNGDGYIDANKLQMVLYRLEFKEGVELEDCEKMIYAFNENGDGRINFAEFRKMLENVK